MKSSTQKETRQRYITRDRIQTVFDSSMPDLVMAQARTDGFIFGQEIAYTSDAKVNSLSFDDGVVEWKQSHPWGRVEIIFRFAIGVLRITMRGKSVDANAYAIDDEAAKRLLDLTRERIPPCEPDENVVRIAFWRHHPRGGPISESREVVCPSWNEIQDNYADSTRRALERLFMSQVDSTVAGKLVLWHGEPGTGKTFALRSWGRACSDWMNINYIVDPEVFFGSNANYMLELLMRPPGEKLNLFVAEDTGELLARDAKREKGQALSRLLNVCDGLIGQGMRILFLITTNEELGALHPAVARPGRCYANIGFEAFGQKEATEWLCSRGVEEAPVSSRRTIAELYSIVDSNQIVAQKPKVFGFVS